MIDYYSANRQPLTHYVRCCNRADTFTPSMDCHTMRAMRTFGTGKTVQEMLEELGLKIRIVPQVGIDNGSGRAPHHANVWIDDKCADGIRCLGIIITKQTRTAAHAKPAHDWSKPRR